MRRLSPGRQGSIVAASAAALALLAAASVSVAGAAPAIGADVAPFPPALDAYGDAQLRSLSEILSHRIAAEPFNLVATLLFLGAVVHTFLTHRLRHFAHVLEERHESRLRALGEALPAGHPRVSAAARLFHFLGEVEAVFGIWVVPLLLALAASAGRPTARRYVEHGVDFTEAIFVVTIMAIASTRPILELSERLLQSLARLGGGTPRAWWLALLTAGPLLGSLVTEPAAMTICASLLSRRFYALRPSPRLAYATLGLLFVAISVGGTLTHFAAPPVLMVAGAWGWDTPFMLREFGWKAALGIALAAGAYLLAFRRELGELGGRPQPAEAGPAAAPVPAWVTAIHLAFLVFAVWNAHHASLLVLGLLFFLAVVEVTEDFQRDFSLRPPILVGFFLAGLVVHGGLQGWWIEPVLGRLSELPLLLGATALTAFNDNAAITYLATLVPSFGDPMKHAVVAGAVAGGGLTVIANAPNPAGQAILGRHFEGGIGALGLLGGALLPTAVVLLCFLLLG